MSRGRFRVSLDRSNRDDSEPGASASTARAGNDASHRSRVQDHVLVFSTKHKSGWKLRQKKPKTPHYRADFGTRVVKPVPNANEKDPEIDQEADSTASNASQAYRQAMVENIISLNRPQGPVRETMFDLFQEAAVSLTSEEQNTLFKYLQFAPAVAYGSNGSGSFCPNRDIAWRSTEVYSEGLQWLLADCDTLISLSQNAPFPPRLHQRKARSYRYVRKLLADPKTQTSDEAICCVTAAMAVESRALDPRTNRMHLKGLYQMIRQRGVDSLYSTVSFMYHPLFCLGFFVMSELEVDDPKEAERCALRFFRTIAWMQHAIQGVDMWPEAESKDETFGTSPRRMAYGRSKSSEIGPSHSWPSLAAHTSVHHDAIRLLIPGRKDEVVMQTLSRFLNLLLFNLILCDFSKSPLSGILFLERFNSLIDSSSATDASTGRSTLKVEIIIWIIAKAWTEVDSASHGSEPGKEVYLTEMAIDALKVFGRLNGALKERLMSVLLSWLVADKGSAADEELHRTGEKKGSQSHVGMETLSRDDVEMMQQEACGNWYEENIGSI